mmetsp:Transcript_29009/g.85863  ORF Transcript_29009/g.85863 Transcript_29009/m.85863 type:complete len:227 (+) Transcript_29009:230-910(+)
MQGLTAFTRRPMHALVIHLLLIMVGKRRIIAIKRYPLKISVPLCHAQAQDELAISFSKHACPPVVVLFACHLSFSRLLQLVLLANQVSFSKLLRRAALDYQLPSIGLAACRACSPAVVLLVVAAGTSESVPQGRLVAACKVGVAAQLAGAVHLVPLQPDLAADHAAAEEHDGKHAVEEDHPAARAQRQRCADAASGDAAAIGQRDAVGLGALQGCGGGRNVGGEDV